MKVIFTVYYSDFARYFAYLDHCLDKLVPEKKESLFVCFYPSAYWYLKIRGYNAVLLSQLIEKKIVKNAHKKPLLSGSDEYNLLKKLTHYQAVVLNDSALRDKLSFEAKWIVKAFHGLLESQSYDVMVSSGDTRLQTLAAIDVAKKKGLQVWFFEQGALGTTLFDTQGVNANASFRGRVGDCHDYNALTLTNYLRAWKKNQQKSFDADFTIVDHFMNKLDLLYLYPCSWARGFMPLFMQSGDSFSQFFLSKIRAKRKTKINNKLPCKYIAFPLQMPNDAQVVYHSPLYNNFTEMLSDIIEALPDGLDLMVREHPNYIGRYNGSLYQLIEQDKRVHLNNDINLNDFLSGAEVVVVNNSTVGVEAIAMGKNVVLLGDAYYESDEVFFKVKSKDEIQFRLAEAVEKEVSVEARGRYLYDLIFNRLIPGHFRDYYMSGGEKIARAIDKRLSSK